MAPAVLCFEALLEARPGILSFERRCSHEAPPEDRRRGRTDFLAGRVSLEPAPDGALARVQTNDTYFEVRLDWADAVERSAVIASCECARFREYAVCRHIWATLLAVDRELGDPVPGRSSLDLDLEVPEPEWLEQLDVPAPALGKSFDQPAWRRPLTYVRAAFEEPEGDLEIEAGRYREIWYRLNIYQSMDRGRLVVDFLQREERQDGSLGKIKPLQILESEVQNLDNPEDRHLLRLFFATGGASADARGRLSSGFVPGILYEAVVPRLCATGRFGPSDADGIARSLEWDDGPPWSFVLRVERPERRDDLLITGALERGAERRSLAEPLVLLPDGLVVLPGTIARLSGEDFPWMAVLRSEGRLVVPGTEIGTLLADLERLPRLPILDLAKPVKPYFARSSPRPSLVIRLDESHRAQLSLAGELRFDYGGTLIGRREPRAGALEDEVLTVRDHESEHQAFERLRELGARPCERRRTDVELPPGTFTDIASTLIDEDWTIEAEGRRVRPPGSLQMRLSSGIDWFELDGEALFGGVAVDLPELLRAIGRGERFVRLGDGTQGLLPEEWLERYGPLVRLARDQDDSIGFLPSQALLLDALLEDGPPIEADDGFRELRSRLDDFAGVESAQEPASFQGTLRAYQRAGLGWLRFLQEMGFGGCLADDMGLGKTVQVLALLAERGIARLNKPSLVVAPRSVLDNWLAEAKRFAPELRTLPYHGSDRAASMSKISTSDLVVTTYGTLRRDILELREIDFDYIVLDEAQAIKNPASQSAKASRALRATHRLALTGTPVENHLGELWSLFEFLNPGMLGQLPELAEAAHSPRPDADTLALIGRALRPFLLRRTKEEVLTDLPEKTEQTLVCELGDEQRALYDELRDHYRGSFLGLDAAGLRRSRLQVLEALLRLRQAACHPGLLGDHQPADAPSAKLETLLDHLEEILAEGHKALIFSQFVSFLSIVRDAVKDRRIDHEYLDGRTRNRKERIARFQEDPDCRLFLISLKAGGLGLNLTAADYVYILDPWWNPAVESQAIDRAHRIGQTRPVFAYRLIAAETVEEKILSLQAQKRELADAILAAERGPLKDLTLDDLRLLLS